MALIRDPLRRNQFIRVNDRYDRQDIVVENALSQKRQFQDVEKTDQLTQNGWNFSPYTRSDSYRDLSIGNQPTVGRIERNPGTNNFYRYHGRRYL